MTGIDPPNLLAASPGTFDGFASAQSHCTIAIGPLVPVRSVETTNRDLMHPCLL